MRATATATLTGFLGPGLDAGPIIARTDSYQSICIGSLQPHLCRHAVVQSASSNRDCWLLMHAPLFGQTLMTPRPLHQGVFTTVYELRRGFMTLANINCCFIARLWHGVAVWAVINYPYSGSKLWQYSANTNSPFGPLFGPVRIRIKYSVQPYSNPLAYWLFAYSCTYILYCKPAR